MIWEKFGQFLSEHSKVSKLGLWWNPFAQRRKCMSLKYTGYLCVMTEECCKIWRGIDSSVQNWHEEFDEFHPSTQESQKFARNYVWWHWILMQNFKENWLVLSEMPWGIRQIFTRALEILKIGIFTGSLYPK